jgi:hypothetical protein
LPQQGLLDSDIRQHEAQSLIIDVETQTLPIAIWIEIVEEQPKTTIRGFGSIAQCSRSAFTIIENLSFY